MSAIVGIDYLDGLSVNRADLALMLDTLVHRGPDGADMWLNRNIGLGHRMLWTTPESLIEKQPLVNWAGDLVITADARIDNREELFSQLNLNDSANNLSDRRVTDSQLILEAYKKWGEHCPEYLLGDFAFAIWDGRQKILFCARDHFGVKPFYYYKSEQVFIFASEIKALLSLSQVPCRLNETRIGDYLTLMMEDKAIATYRDILRLPPAHSMVISPDDIRIWSYWELNIDRQIELPSNEAYAQEFRKIFTEAVRCRLRSAFPVISHLSGGLDSSAVTCVARDLLNKTRNSKTGNSKTGNSKTEDKQLQTISSVFDKVSECDERPFINAVLEQGGVTPHYVRGDEFGPLSNLANIFEYEDEALLGPSHFYPWQLNHTIKQLGLRISLDGFDGDTTVSHGMKRLTELARKGEWETCIEESKAVSKHFDTEAYSIFRNHCLPYLQDCAKNWRWISFFSAVGKIYKHFGGSRKQLIIRYGIKPLVASLKSSLIPRFIQKMWLSGGSSGVITNAAKSLNPLVNHEFAERIGLLKRIQQLKLPSKQAITVREEHWYSLNKGILSYTLEQIDQYAASFSIEARHPFMDKRLIEFCLALPAHQKLDGGFGRVVMRRALTGILPEKVQWRGGKTNLGPNFIDSLLVRDRQFLDRVMSEKLTNLEKYINMDFLQESYQRLIWAGNKATDKDSMAVWRAVILALWLEHKQISP